MNSFAFSEKKIKVVRLIRIKIYKNRGSSDNPDNKGPKIIRIATFIFQNDLLGGFRGSFKTSTFRCDFCFSFVGGDFRPDLNSMGKQ